MDGLAKINNQGDIPRKRARVGTWPVSVSKILTIPFIWNSSLTLPSDNLFRQDPEPRILLGETWKHLISFKASQNICPIILSDSNLHQEKSSCILGKEPLPNLPKPVGSHNNNPLPQVANLRSSHKGLTITITWAFIPELTCSWDQWQRNLPITKETRYLRSYQVL